MGTTSQRMIGMQRLELWQDRSPEEKLQGLRKNESKNNDVVNVVTDEVKWCSNLVDSWVIDSGASFHTTGYRDVVENYVTESHEKAS